MVKVVSRYVTLLLGVILWLLNGSISEPIVRLDNGQIRGLTVKFYGLEVNQFLSIRYAEPPVGELRYKKTEKLRLVPTDYEAVYLPPACLQYTESPYPLYINGSYKSEDCLFLNIWTPYNAYSTLKAVMFWVHGDGFLFGSAQDPLYNGLALAALGDIIVVTINYRLGSFGFLTTDTEEAPGNAGLYDVLEALKWVHQNIYFFGGDPQRITIAGHGAGADIVGELSISPLGEGLFSQMLMESGSPVEKGPDTRPENLALAERLAREVGCLGDSQSLSDYPVAVTKCLKSIDAEVLEKAEFTLMEKTTASFYPQHGDEFQPNIPRKAVFNGEFRCKKLLIGNNRDEGSYFITTLKPEIFGFFGEKYTQSSQTVSAEVADSLLTFLFPELQFESRPYTLYELYTIVGDLFVICPDNYFAENCADVGGEVFYYVFDHRSATTPWAPWMGVARYEELQFVFGKPLLNPTLYEPQEGQISAEIIKYWSNFVRTGKPNAYWPLYCRLNPDFRYLGNNDPANMYGRGPHKETCERFRSFYES